MGVFSAGSKNKWDYISKNGSSMAVATVTGTIALLQEQFHNLNNVYMKSATVKALLISTADEVGKFDGPDFQSGWGLVNAERAARVISENEQTGFIREVSITEGDTLVLDVTVDGTRPLSVTIAWTDPPGTPVNGLDNTTPVLVNDLDLRICNTDTIFYPWKFTPNNNANNFTDAATKGDNFRDNIERIDVDSVAAGNYQIKISHKNSLSTGMQNFSIVVQGILMNGLQTSLKIKNDLPFTLFPNPLSGNTLNIVVPNSVHSEKIEIQLFDVSGNQLRKEIFYKNNMHLDVSDLKPGYYIFRIKTDKKYSIKKIIRV